MSQLLKDSTFAIREVFSKSLSVLKDNYLSIAMLCFCMFLISSCSSILAKNINHVSDFLSGFMAILFVTIYFGFNLGLFKVILRILNRREKETTRVVPTGKELLFFFGGMLSIFIVSIIILGLLAVLCWPIIYLGISIGTMVSTVVFFAFIFTFLFVIRVAFYPFFIIDKKESPIRAIRLSFTMTRGNVLKLISIILIFAVMHGIQFYASIWVSFYIGILISLVNSFLIVPLSSIVVTVAYREMMLHIDSKEDLGFFKNII